MLTIKLTLDEPGKARSSWCYEGQGEEWLESTMDKEIAYFLDRGFHVITRDSRFCRMTRSERNCSDISVLDMSAS